MTTHSLIPSPHEARALSEIAFDKALYAAWACSWRDHVAAGDFDPVEDTAESLELATQRAECAMADAKAALAAAMSGPGGTDMTTTHSVNLTEHEVRAALRRELGLVVRPVKPQPTNGLRWNAVVLNGYGGWTDEHGKPFPCPLGVPGDRVVCKETWCRHWRPDTGYLKEALYRADGIVFDNPEDGSPWKAATCMPRWASRITLEVEEVRCCLLGELTANDARAAGFDGDDVMAVGALNLAWQKRYQPKGLGIETRPYVWTAKVKRVAA